jgi:N-acetylmuramoyl-L-alanine amidase
MHLSRAIAIGVALTLAHRARAAPNITVVYPPEGAVIAPVDSSFIFGSVNPPRASLFINGVRVPVYRTGGFLAFLPLRPGPFAFDCVAISDADTTRILRHVRVGRRASPLSSTPLTVDSSSVEPSDDMSVTVGDVILVRVRASPGATAWFELARRRLPMTTLSGSFDETDARVEAFGGESNALSTSGVYAGSYVVQPSDSLASERIVVTVASARDTLRLTAPGRVSSARMSPPAIVEFTDSLTVARTAPGAGYSLFVPRGVRAAVSGGRGASVRLRVATDVDVWVPRASVRTLPAGTPAPHPRIGTIHVEEHRASSEISVTVNPPIPYRVEESTEPARYTVTLYGATADVDWIHYTRGAPVSDTADAYIREVRWQQPVSDAVRITVDVAGRRPWGYRAEYVGSTLRFTAFRPPSRLKKRGLFHRSPPPLSGLLIAVDAGHSPDTGASGPTGLLERDANLAIARALGDRLHERGARIIFTRPDTAGVVLAARPRIAAQSGANLLVSVHLNALPDGVNPFLHHGTSVYYYHPHSLTFAEAVHRSLLERLRRPDFGLYYGNLALTRPTEMPAILTESTFLMLPEEEEWLRSRDGVEKIAEAIADGVEQFIRNATWAEEQKR